MAYQSFFNHDGTGEQLQKNDWHGLNGAHPEKIGYPVFGPWGFQGWNWLPGWVPSPLPDLGPARSAPAEPAFVDINPNTNRWEQGGQPMPKDWKPTKYLARPIDGKRTGWSGRLMDGLKCEGPDVFLVINGDKRTKSYDNPHRAQWSKWSGPDWDKNFLRKSEDPDQTYAGGLHDAMRRAVQSKKYNFKSRKYEDRPERQRQQASGQLWTDAYWPDNAKRGDENPWSFRTGPAEWTSRVPLNAGALPGGRNLWPW